VSGFGSYLIPLQCGARDMAFRFLNMLSYWVVAMALFIASFTMGGLTYVTTVMNLRARRMSMMRLPMTAWMLFITLRSCSCSSSSPTCSEACGAEDA
jgi:cytochrome c oxidase subunit 1